MNSRHIGVYLALAATWMVWSGSYTVDLSTGEVNGLILTFGVLSCLFVTIIVRRMDLADTEGFPIHLSLRAMAYVPWLIWQIVLSNLAVAKLILQPRPDLSPTLFRTRATQPSDLGVVIYANSITLTPGTVSILLADGQILVHALTRELADDVQAGEMDRRCTAIDTGHAAGSAPA